ncbi:hypothetical protein G6011_01689 [Alternaria panax]|uniref:Uncharacterized protein n=1 Tax=Alternaria panax TaxID=48097 RepID=A0AAD4NW15_9PLEO|nr:hypothetical protein G6011_01689 [Alternaria panax]
MDNSKENMNKKNAKMSPLAKDTPKQQEDAASTVSEGIQSILQHITTIETEVQELKHKLRCLSELEGTPSPSKKTRRAATSKANSKRDNEDEENKGNGGDEEEEEEGGEDEDGVAKRSGLRKKARADKAGEEVKKPKQEWCNTCGGKMEADARPSYVNCKECRAPETARYNARILEKKKKDKKKAKAKAKDKEEEEPKKAQKNTAADI